MSCWSIIEDINCILETTSTKQELEDALRGLNVLYKWKFESMFGTFEDLVSSRGI